MRETHLFLLVCPVCKQELLLGEVTERRADILLSASLICTECRTVYPVIGAIPRFVSSTNYATNFGHEWMMHARTQYDSVSGTPSSATRFFGETRWPRNLRGE